jgi:hypothetical protein
VSGEAHGLNPASSAHRGDLLALRRPIERPHLGRLVARAREHSATVLRGRKHVRQSTGAGAKNLPREKHAPR